MSMKQKKETQPKIQNDEKRNEMGCMSYKIGIAHHKAYNEKKKTCKLKNVDNNTTLCPFYEIDVVFKRKLSIETLKLEEIFETYRTNVFVSTNGEYMIKIYTSSNGFTLYAFVNTEVCHPKHYHEKLEKLKKFECMTCLKDIDSLLKDYYVEELNNEH